MAWIAPAVALVDEPLVGDERVMLEGFLDWQRASFLQRCTGLTAGQLTERAVPPSSLSLLGLVRHLTDVERTWFRRRFGGEDLEPAYTAAGGFDPHFDLVDAGSAERDHHALVAEWDLCRKAVAGVPLDPPYPHPRFGEMSLRWMYLHMLREYSGHCGHADLLRERIDGVTFG